MKKKARIEKALFKTVGIRDNVEDSLFKSLYSERVRVLEWVLSDLDQDLY